MLYLRLAKPKTFYCPSTKRGRGKSKNPHFSIICMYKTHHVKSGMRASGLIPVFITGIISEI